MTSANSLALGNPGQVSLDREALTPGVRQGQLSVDVVVPAYNEERNITSLLADVTMQQELPWFKIGRIYVVVDPSTDRTEALAAEFASRDPRVQLVTKPRRAGQADSLNWVFRESGADVVVSVDADVRLADNLVVARVVRPFADDANMGMACGRAVPMPFQSTFRVAEHASYFGWMIEQAMKEQFPDGILSVRGCILALSRSLYQGLTLPVDLPGNDTYMYLCCVSMGMKFLYVPEGSVFYRLPGVLGDHIKQGVRLRFAMRGCQQIFGSQLTRFDRSPGVLLRLIVKRPLDGFLWLFAYGLGELNYWRLRTNGRPVGGLWQVSDSTK